MRIIKLAKSVKTFRIDEGSDIEKWFNTQTNASESVVDIINRFLSKELRPVQELEDEEELKRNYLIQRNRKLEKQCLRLDIQNRISLVTELKYSPDEASKIAKGEMSIDDDNKLHCTELNCNWSLDYKPVDITVEVDHMIQHIKDEHKRDANQTEQKKFMELIA